MGEVFGHESVRAILERELPPVTLLVGPSSVGKWTLASHLASFHGVFPIDRRRWEKLTVEGAREVRAFAGSAPFGALKLVMVRLDGASNESLNALLKVIEEPPSSLRFILTSSVEVLPTIKSRAHVHRLGLLSIPEMQSVLVTNEGMSPQIAARAAALGRGQVRGALAVDANETSRSSVITVLKAISERDSALFNRAFKSWDDDASRFLHCWLREAVSGQWSVFSEAESFGLHRGSTARRMIMAISPLAGARPKLQVRVGLAGFLFSK